MKIRSITCFLPDDANSLPEAMKKAQAFVTEARSRFQTAGIEVQTARLATVPFPQLLPSKQLASLPDFAYRLETAAQAAGFDYLSLGPAQPEALDAYAAIAPALAATQNVFFSGSLLNAQGKISLAAVQACGQVIADCASISADGFGNLRFTALAKVGPGAPFFPAAYGTGKAGFALAMEAADLAVEAFGMGSSLEAARQDLVDRVERAASQLSEVSRALSQDFSFDFEGIDFTLAPFPDAALSAGTALERLGVPAVGLHGSLAAAAVLTDTLDRAEFQRVGFNGLMLPVLEDAALAQRAAQGNLSLKDLLMYSAVCGTGLDTIPLPGDASPAALSAVLLDLAALAVRLSKPLTARLMPIPGKAAGEPTEFSFSYFANSRVMALEAAPLTGFFAGKETIEIRSRVRA